MVIDAHCHAGKGEGFTGPWDTSAHLGRYIRRAKRAGIHKTVLFSVFHPDYSAANRAVASIVASRPDRFYGFAFVHPQRDAGRIGPMIKEAVLEYHFCGIKVHRHDGRITREVCEAARRFAIPVLYDIMGEVSVVEMLAEEYPDVNFIIPHLGSFGDDWKAQKALIDQLVKHRNIFADTAGIRYFDLLVEAVHRAGAEKILFGSDGPFLHPGVELAKIHVLGLNEHQKRLVLSENFLRLTGLSR